nr:MAG TPA: hypothetical protein [Caudoviricetes sp.]
MRISRRFAVVPFPRGSRACGRFKPFTACKTSTTSTRF